MGLLISIRNYLGKTKKLEDIFDSWLLFYAFL